MHCRALLVKIIIRFNYAGTLITKNACKQKRPAITSQAFRFFYKKKIIFSW